MKIMHELTHTNPHKKAKETYEYITQRLCQSFQGTKFFKLNFESSINEALLTSSIYINNKWHSSVYKKPREALISHPEKSVEFTTPHSEDENESSERASDTTEKEEITSANFVVGNENNGKLPPVKEKNGKLLEKIISMFGSGKKKDSQMPSDQTHINSQFQLRLDASIVMRMSSDQLMQVSQLQTRLSSSSTIEEAQRILAFSAFYKNLSLNDKVLFRSGNPTFF